MAVRLTRNYDATATISAAVATIKPELMAPPVYHTGRSGLPVVLGNALFGIDNHAGLPAFPVKIDGTIDKHDAEQLGAFFTALSKAMQAV